MKKLWNLGLLLAGLALSGADQYKSIDTKDKLNDKDLLFAATFDRGTVNADFAKGDGFSTNMKNVGLLLRGMIGFDGKPAYRPEPGEDLMFDAVKNVDPHQGTVTMWLCCRDYNPSQPNKRGNIALLQMMFKQGQRHILMQFYECDELYFDWWSSEPPNTLGRVVATRPGIGKGQWHQVALTWVDRSLRHQVMFGSDNPRFEQIRMAHALDGLGLRESTVELIKGGNAIEFLGGLD